MRKALVRAGIALGVLFALAATVLVVNQTAQVVTLLDRVHPAAGTVGLWSLVVMYALCLSVPVLLVLRFPSPLIPPDTEDEKDIERYETRLRARLRAHPLLQDEGLKGLSDLDTALSVLNAHADRIIRQTSSRVFLSTAVSQYGSLSSLLVLGAQAKMIWDVAHIYHQRPGLRQLLSLYGNVAATVFVAGRIEDLDVSEYIEPVVSSSVGSVVGAVPGFQAASGLLVNAVFVGSTNAFLTLRVGVITKRYCSAVVLPERTGLWQSATLEAAGLLRGIVATGAKAVSGAFVSASGRAIGGVVKGIGASVRSSGSSIAGRMRFKGSSTLPEDEDGGVGPEVEPQGKG